MKPKILISDNLHFHTKGFKSLFHFIEKNSIEHIFIEHKEKELLFRFGDYNPYLSIFTKYYQSLQTKTKEELYSFKYMTLNIFSLSKSEILSLVMTYENWYTSKIKNSNIFIFEKLFDENREILLQNMAVTLYWIDFWKPILEQHKHFSHCCIFSGSLIYQKTLIALLKNTPIRSMVFEHFFTGNDYYCEHKYQHIANNSDIKFKNYYTSLIDLASLDIQTIESEKRKALLKVLHSNNKNVTQPPKTDPIFFPNNEKTLLILGQVANDFSILETPLENISSITFYQNFIDRLVANTQYNIIFKAHPWENKKANLKTPLTFQILQKHITQNKLQERVILVEDYNIEALFEISHIVTTLCSQGALEASFAGKKVVQFGKAFYGEKGFTYDFSSIEHFINTHQTLNPNLTLEEYVLFETFLLKMLQYHLISSHTPENNLLEKRFKIEKSFPLYDKPIEKEENKTLDLVQKTYENSTLKTVAQKIKKIPFLGKILLKIKHKVLKWQ